LEISKKYKELNEKLQNFITKKRKFEEFESTTKDFWDEYNNLNENTSIEILDKYISKKKKLINENELTYQFVE
jgi:hypothetical protein